MVGKLCGPSDDASPPQVLASPTDQVYQLYDDYFQSVDTQPTWTVRRPLPRPEPVAWPEPVVLPADLHQVVSRTYVPVTQKMPHPAGMSRSPPDLRGSFVQLLQGLREQWYANLPEAAKKPPVPPARTSSLPKGPVRPLPPPGVPMPPPPAPNPKRPLPVPPVQTTVRRPRPALLPLPPPPGPPPTIPLPEPPKGLLPAQDRSLLSPNDVRGFVQATSGLRPLRLPQLVAERRQGLRPLWLPEVTRLARLGSPLAEETELAYLQPRASVSGSEGTEAAPEGSQESSAAAKAPSVVGLAQ